MATSTSLASEDDSCQPSENWSRTASHEGTSPHAVDLGLSLRDVEATAEPENGELAQRG